MADIENDREETAHFSYIWTIENACLLFYAQSPTFSVAAMEMTKWLLQADCLDNKTIDLTIHRDDSDNGPECIEITFELSFLGNDGTPLKKETGVCSFFNGFFFEFNEFADPEEVFSRRRAEFLPKDALTLRCRMWRTGTEISKPELCFARTHIRPNRHCFIWAITEFGSLRKNQEQKLLYKTANKQIVFKLFIRESDAEEYIAIGVQAPYITNCSIKIGILDFEGKVEHSVEKYFCGNEHEIGNIFKITELMEDKETLLPDDVLTLRVEFEIIAKAAWSRIENYRHLNSKDAGMMAIDEGEIVRYETNDISIESPSFEESMKKLLDEGALSDISLRTTSKSFPAHKCVLSARSPVFKSMFTGDMREKTSKFVEIPDFDEDTIRELLHYIYTDKLDKLGWQSITDLYRAADKYELLDLKRRCATFLKSDFSTHNVCVILNVADLHNDPKLRKAAEDFVMYQRAEFFTSDMWRSFKEENSKLYMEILEKIVGNMKRV